VDILKESRLYFYIIRKLKIMLLTKSLFNNIKKYLLSIFTEIPVLLIITILFLIYNKRLNETVFTNLLIFNIKKAL